MRDAPNIALFGGSFDPPHLGHLQAARAAKTAADLDRVIFIPCHQSPHKPSAAAATGSQRLEMLRLLSEGHAWVESSEFEINRTTPSFSWITAEHFHKTLPPGTKLHWILGTDQWQKLPTWSKPDRLAELLHFIVVARPGYAPQPSDGFSATFVYANHPASSTSIRSQLAENTQPPSSWLPEALAAYIRHHSLYSSSDP